MDNIKSQEVSLIDLWKVLVAEKALIFKVWLAFVLLGLAYVLLVTPVYKVEAFLLPPSQQDIQVLNIQTLNNTNTNTNYSPKNIYNLLIQTLKSRSNQRSFYDKNGIADSLGYSNDRNQDVFFENVFYQHMKITRGKKVEKNVLSIAFESKKNNEAVGWVNRYITETGKEVSSQLQHEVLAKVAGFKTSIATKIEGKLLLAKKRRMDQIARLEEALVIAKMLLGKNKSFAVSGRLAMNVKKLPLYILGQDVLKAQIKMLKLRKDDAPFIKGLRELQEKMAALEQVAIDTSDIRTMTFDQAAFVQSSPIKPKKVLIVILAGLLGLMLSVIFVLVRSSVRKYDENE